MTQARFEWDENKNAENLRKHGVPFELAQYAFADPKRVIAEDVAHSHGEKRLLLRESRRWHSHGSVHLPRRGYPANWCRLLAKRKANL